MTSSRTAHLTLVTSVNGQPGADLRIWASMPGKAGIGTASTINASVAAARVSVWLRSVMASNPSERAPWAPSTDRL
ncbi:Uncharacterised protein [Mycobacterium tuberculosis]|uniref:Uncharacterized protein n=1 Tax=Mycobacterium tuberculosis TaxID=1773 RepID=A0A654TWH0_MYCTX|nr:Uncharacterised protein [Mycobacterium tuberculosis]CFS20172.1 Uncharacterised protein [Mycobacterium tuberculosis]COV22301.1 Uncharacterised protein [Mycobacterium tuberculosis]COY85349.1 Uncharacterised protein [Mycobacterium tuberculosis]